MGIKVKIIIFFLYKSNKGSWKYTREVFSFPFLLSYFPLTYFFSFLLSQLQPNKVLTASWLQISSRTLFHSNDFFFVVSNFPLFSWYLAWFKSDFDLASNKFKGNSITLYMGLNLSRSDSWIFGRFSVKHVQIWSKCLGRCIWVW